jgi:hypothetical protein
MKRIVILLFMIGMVFSNCNAPDKNSFEHMTFTAGKAIFKFYITTAIAAQAIEVEGFENVSSYVNEEVDYLDYALSLHNLFMNEWYSDPYNPPTSLKNVDAFMEDLIKSEITMYEGKEDTYYQNLVKEWKLLLKIYQKLPNSASFKFIEEESMEPKIKDTKKKSLMSAINTDPNRKRRSYDEIANPKEKKFNITKYRSKDYPDFIMEIHVQTKGIIEQHANPSEKDIREVGVSIYIDEQIDL